MATEKEARSSPKKRAGTAKETASGVAAGRKSKAVSGAATNIERLIREDSAESGLKPADIKKLGRRPSTKADLRKTKFPADFGMPDAYQIPYFDIDGKQLRYERTKFIGGKYRQPTGSRPHLYFSPLLRKKWRTVVKNPKVRIYWSEGEKKSDAACRVGIPTVSVGGCWSWLHKGKPIPDFDEFDWEDHEMVLVFDNDIVNKPNVRSALNALAREFRKRGATVLQILLPFPGPKGLDDYLVVHGKAAFLKLAEQAFEPPPDWLDVMNERHFVAQEGTKFLVFEDKDELSALRVEDFKHRYMNKSVPVGEAKKRLGQAWLDHPDRRQYDRVVFDPTGVTKENTYNRWRGLPIEPIQGDWSLPQAHIRDNLCRGNKECYDYLMRWMAFGIQNPAKPTEIAIVLRGEQGTGKGIFARAYGSLFAPYFYHASSPEEVVGRFNGHLAEVLALFLDEAFFAGDRAHTGALKRIITEPTISIERKFRDRVETPNRLKIIVASNENWLIPAGMSERRFFVLDVAPDKMQDKKYFGGIAEQLRSGGREAMMYDLLHMDITAFDHRTCPRTEALADQQAFSLGPVESYWYGLLELGELPGTEYRKFIGNKVPAKWGVVPKQVLHADFCEQARLRGIGHLPDIASFGKRLKKLLPPGYPRSKKLRNGVTRTPVWEFPCLRECIGVWERLFGVGPRGPGPRA